MARWSRRLIRWHRTRAGVAGMIVALVLLISALPGFVPPAEAHPGGTDGSGCHTCRTNCPSWGISNGFYHRHSPVRSCFAQVATSTPSPTRTPAPTRIPTTVATPTPTPSARPPPSSASGDYSQSVEFPSAARSEISNTGGLGISLRSACADDVRRGGAWGEGLSVFVLARGNVACEGWLVIQREGETTWVRDRYVAAFTEPTPTPPPTPTEVARTATSVPATAGPLPSTLEPEPDGAGGGGMAAAGFLILAGGAIGAWMWMRSRVPG